MMLFRKFDLCKCLIWFLLVVSVALLGLSITCIVVKGEVGANNVNITEALSKSTVRICCGRFNTNKVSIGTAFMVLLKQNDKNHTSVPVLITNKHVIKGSQYIQFVFSEKGTRDLPPKKIPVRLPIGENGWRFHPDKDVDLCAMPIAPILREVEAKKLNVDIAPLSLNLVAGFDEMKELRQLDEIVMVGYPDGYIDDYNNQPIFRRGVIATDPVRDYKNKKEFLVDIAVYPGSSGSPILVLKEGVFFDRNKQTAMISKGGGYCRLVGVLYAGHMHDVTGHPVPVPVPTAVTRGQPWVPNNLGIVIKAERIKELEKLF